MPVRSVLLLLLLVLLQCRAQTAAGGALRCLPVAASAAARQHSLERWEPGCDLSEEGWYVFCRRLVHLDRQSVTDDTQETDNLTFEYLNFSLLRSGEHLCYFLSDLKWGQF